MSGTTGGRGRQTRTRSACAASLALGLLPATAWADAPRDIQANQRLWLDGWDINGTSSDIGNGGASNPATGAQVTAWKDKSPNGYTAGDAVSFGSFPHSFPTYLAGQGVSCDGVNNALEITKGIHPTGNVTASDIFVVATTGSTRTGYLFLAGLPSGYNSISAFVPGSDLNLAWYHHQLNGKTTATWGGTLNRAYLYNFSATSGVSQAVRRDGSNFASTGSSGTYVKGADENFFICNGGNAYSLTAHHGVVSEMIVYNRRLSWPEKYILESYLAAKHGNPGGAGSFPKYGGYGTHRYYVGGIGQELGSIIGTGTSAGLTIANSTFLPTGAAGNYFLAGVESLSPSTGTVSTDAPPGFAVRSQRTWYAKRSGTSTGNITLTFNLAQMGVSASTGDSLALAYRSGAVGTFTALSTVTYGGAGTISFTVSDPQTGYYALAAPDAAAPDISLALTNAVVSDGVNDTNFKMIPGALLHTSAVVTNSGNGSPDADTVEMAFPIQPATKLFIGDLAGAGSGPVQFTQGATSSSLSYSYTSLASMVDRLDFSNDSGATWTYVPTPDVQQADAAVTNLRVRLGGTFATGTSPNFPSFTLKYGLVIK